MAIGIITWRIAQVSKTTIQKSLIIKIIFAKKGVAISVIENTKLGTVQHIVKLVAYVTISITGL